MVVAGELDAAKALIPEGNFSVLVREDSSDWKERVATIDPVSVNFDVDHITEENVTYVHGLNKKVFVFTVNTQEQFDRMAKLGVDGVFTDFSEISTLGQ